MSTGTLIAIIVAIVIVLLLCALVASTVARRRHLKERFGPEYERAVEDKESRTAGERELREREQRHDALEIKPLSAMERDKYAEGWSRAQGRFVDQPDEAVHEADRLVTALMSERGYPTKGFEQQVSDLSVEHSRTLDHYRAAHDVNVRSGGHQATTEELRGAMVHYRALFDELLHDGHQR
ncbi:MULTISPECIES: hypothetical protein [unclassified Streptomyces]|uniref:hypothetical protein n=1 Tax=unclassified Streptomyces TaxID=2593676 RepID=UPI0022585604|nr:MULTISPECIES: hypothetical protein [unclassified Streptomyces]WSP59424.1 hypothetical protein OG306_37380 [Streptomyces sp. NBC_01241]WSU20056.1 hypothetical protein OG508_02985 [Streptomyces sp. NBC_01108]MCX4791190.1 hypothetical protein [Streptomyces sp. NBC_01221]MCX4793095.1 hypothetical protein [Streptomyces sp. NBC_01242]WSP60985.1 hypothetical protein OG466_03070 [Streptomyces sp. NBC_01240]